MRNKKVLRKSVASIFWSLKEDWKEMDLKDIYYDVGLAVGYCQAIDRADISHKIYDKFILLILILPVLINPIFLSLL